MPDLGDHDAPISVITKGRCAHKIARCGELARGTTTDLS
jgi:hypothetical protein